MNTRKRPGACTVVWMLAALALPGYAGGGAAGVVLVEEGRAKSAIVAGGVRPGSAGRGTSNPRACW